MKWQVMLKIRVLINVEIYLDNFALVARALALRLPCSHRLMNKVLEWEPSVRKYAVKMYVIRIYLLPGPENSYRL